ncbi:DUF4268 domain-containing protein [Azospirillum sp. sgz302134]
MELHLGKLERVDPRKLWEKEAGDFTPWLAKNIGLLGQALGLDLELVQTEKAVGDFSCDIQANDTGRDRPVIIENQLEATDHRHLGQLLTYAAGLDAAVIVWISPEVREEHREALDWLNRHTDDRIEFFGVALEAVRIDDSRPAVQFRLVAFPNAWSKKVTASGSGEVSEKRLRYQQFFQLVIDELREKHNFTNARLAQPQSWYAFSSGISGITYNGAFAGGDRLRAELYIDVGDATRNKAIFDALCARKTELEERIGSLDWERLDQKRACRISLVRSNTSIDDATTQADAMRAWLVQGLLKMKSTFGPLVKTAALV